MVSKAERRRLKRLNEERARDGLPAIVRSQPKTMKALGHTASREPMERDNFVRREPDIHPLIRVRGKIEESEFNAGNTYRIMYEKLARSGVDCTATLGSGAQGGSGIEGWLHQHHEAFKALWRIKGALPDWEHEIVRKVCGEAWPIPDAVHAHSICHEDGTLKAFRNTLNHLVSAISGALVPWSIHNEVRQRRTEIKQIAS